MKFLDLSYQTLYSELAQRSLDAAFTTEFSLAGRFVPVEVKGRTFWYYDAARQPGDEKPKTRLYVGPADDPAIAERVENFKNLKADYQARRKLVSTLVREAHLPLPMPISGDVIGALADAGFFRLRGVLVGTVAFQCYAALLGVRLPATIMQTADADFAQFHAISIAVGDSLPPILDILRKVDPTFREVPHQSDSRRATRYVARSGYQVEFLTPNTGSDDYAGHPAPMPALGTTAAEPLRFLDFLIYQPVRAVVLYAAGVPVLVPAPERYAVHKLIVATRRLTDDDGLAKSRKDRQQAAELMEAMIETRSGEALAEAYIEAWDRGPAWREAVADSMGRLAGPVADTIRSGLQQAARRLGAEPDRYGLTAA